MPTSAQFNFLYGKVNDYFMKSYPVCFGLSNPPWHHFAKYALTIIDQSTVIAY